MSMMWTYGSLPEAAWHSEDVAATVHCSLRPAMFRAARDAADQILKLAHDQTVYNVEEDEFIDFDVLREHYLIAMRFAGLMLPSTLSNESANAKEWAYHLDQYRSKAAAEKAESDAQQARWSARADKDGY